MSSANLSKSYQPLDDGQSPSSSEVFLDTSIHCCFHKGSLFKDRVADVLRRFQWHASSSYSKTEFGNVVLSQAEYFLAKLREFGSLEKMQDFIGNVLPHGLHGAKVTWSFNLLRNHYGENDAECTERARLSLRRLMKIGVGLVEERCDKPLEDGTACYWARAGVKSSRDGMLQWQTPVCKRERKRCRLDDFFVDHRATFLAIKLAIDAIPADQRSGQLQDFSDVIARADKDPSILLDYRTGCKKLADAIIAVESRNYRSFFSQNIAESHLLTQVLGQDFYFLPPNPERGVLVQFSARVGPSAAGISEKVID